MWVTNDSPETVSGKLSAEHRKFGGAVLGGMSADVSLRPGESKRVLNLTEIGILSLRDEFLHAGFNGHESTLLLAAERYLHLPQSRLRAQSRGDAIEISTDVFARQVTLDIEGVAGAVFEDNYFDMLPGQIRLVKILNAGGGRAVRIRALNSDSVGAQLQ